MGFRKAAIGLAAASALEFGLQLVIPVILVRTLDPTTFGQYRFLWLLAGTTLAWAPLFIPQSLFYFLSRNSKEAGEVVTNTVVYLLIAGIIVGVITSGSSHFLPANIKHINTASGYLASVFLSIWVVASIVDVLPTAMGKGELQAKFIGFLAIFRSILLITAAYLASDLRSIVLALICVAVTKLLFLGYFVRTHSAIRPLRIDPLLLRTQLLYAAPFAFGNALFLMRSQADQWIVASTVSTDNYAIFSIAAVLGPIASLIRQPLYNAMMSKLNTAYANKQLNDVAALIARTNGATSLILVPMIGCLFLIAQQLVILVYTNKYASAAPIMQVYLLGMLANTFAVGHVLPALNLGRFLAFNNAVCLCGSAALSYICLKKFGLPGAAIGSAVMLFVSELWSCCKISNTLKVRLDDLLLWGSLLRSGFAALLSTVIVGYAFTFVSSTPVLIILGKFASYLTIYTAIFALLGGRRQIADIFQRKVLG
jgi:O-antigen/teichoic acid export membrane protein